MGLSKKYTIVEQKSGNLIVFVKFLRGPKGISWNRHCDNPPLTLAAAALDGWRLRERRARALGSETMCGEVAELQEATSQAVIT